MTLVPLVALAFAIVLVGRLLDAHRDVLHLVFLAVLVHEGQGQGITGGELLLDLHDHDVIAAGLQSLVLARRNLHVGDLLHHTGIVNRVQLVISTIDVALDLGDGDVLVSGVVQSTEDGSHHLVCALGRHISVLELQLLAANRCRLSTLLGGFSGRGLGCRSALGASGILLLIPAIRTCGKNQRTTEGNRGHRSGTQALLGSIQGGQGHNEPFV